MIRRYITSRWLICLYPFCGGGMGKLQHAAAISVNAQASAENHLEDEGSRDTLIPA